MTVDTWTVEAARDLADLWYVSLDGVATIPKKGTRYAEDVARQVALMLIEDRYELLHYQPGNGTNYSLALLLLPDASAAAWGGRLLVTLPEWPQGGRARAFGLGYNLDPVAVENHLGLRTADAVPLAAFLTLLSAALAESGVRP